MNEVEMFPAAYQVASDIIEAQERELERLRAELASWQDTAEALADTADAMNALESELAQARRWAAAWRVAATFHKSMTVGDYRYDDMYHMLRRVRRMGRGLPPESTPRIDPGKPNL